MSRLYLKTLLLATVFAVVAAVVAVAHAQTFTYKFRYSPIVETQLKTFSATGSLVIYIPPGAYGKINVTVQATNPGSTAADITVTAQCANTPSVTFSVPAGSSATGTLTIIIPTPPTSYVACSISATVPNITGVKLSFMYDTDVEMSYNTTHVIYDLSLFTEPYIVIGTNYYYFDKYNVTLGRYGTTLVNATFIVNFTDTYVTLSRVIAGSALIVEIDNTYHYTGRYLGEMKITAKINEKTANLMFLPVAISPSSTEAPKLVTTPLTEKVVLASGEEVKIGIPSPLTVIDSSGASKTVNLTGIVRVDELSVPTGMSKLTMSNITVGTYNVYLLASGIPKNESTISVLALVNISNWYEPIYASVEIIDRYLNVTTLWTQGEDVGKFVKLTFAALGTAKELVRHDENFTAYVSLVKPPTDIAARYVTYTLPEASNFLIIRVSCEGKPVYDYVYYVGYVSMVDRAGNVIKYYLNVTDAAPVADSSVTATLSGTVPKLTVTLNDYYDVVANTHAALFVPAYGTSVMTQTVSVVAPIRFVYTPIVKVSGLSTVYIYVITDNKEYSKQPRTLVAPTGVTASKISDHCYMIAIPTTYNATPLTFDLSADLAIKVTWNDGSPAKGIVVEVWRGSNLIYRGATDANGMIIVDPTYDSYTVKVIYSGENIVTRTISALTDDLELSIELPVPPPKLEITQVLISAPSKVYAGQEFTMVVTVYTNQPADKTVSLSGIVTCVGPETKTATVMVTIDKGSTVGRGVVKMTLTKLGTYTCWAEVQGVKSINTVQIEVVSKPTATILGMPLPTFIMYIFLAAVIIILIVFVWRMYSCSRRYSLGGRTGERTLG